MQNGTESGVPFWMKAMDEETFYNAGTSDTDDEAAPAPQAPSASSPSSDVPDSDEPAPDGHDGGSEMPLHQKLSLSMDDPSTLPDPDPDLQPAPLGHVRADLNQQLEKAVSVLDARYENNLSKSFFLDVALRQILVDLHMHGGNSTLVSWLDSLLPDR